MAKLCISLPPFAPDYTGACAAFFGLNGLIVVHNVTFCCENLSGFDEPRWDGAEEAVFSSVLTENEIILGREEKLMEKVLDALKIMDPEFIAILGSPIPAFVGTDLEGIAFELEQMTGLPALGVATTGFGFYDRGIAQAGLKLAERFLALPSRKSGSGVNILGATPLDFSANSNLEDLVKVLEGHGFSVVTRFPMGKGLEEFKKAAQAGVNLVVSKAGLPLAEYMEKKFGIPYVVGLPMGDSGISPVLKALNMALDNGISAVIGNETAGEDVLFVGEQVQGNALRSACAAIKGHPTVKVGCLFGMDKKLAAAGDLDLKEERQVRQALGGRWRAIIGDPMLKTLCSRETPAPFFDFPHIAVSSRLSWDTCPVFLGDQVEHLLQIISS